MITDLLLRVDLGRCRERVAGQHQARYAPPELRVLNLAIERGQRPVRARIGTVGTDLITRRLAHQVVDQQLNSQVGDRIPTLNLETRNEGEPRALAILLAVNGHLTIAVSKRC